MSLVRTISMLCLTLSAILGFRAGVALGEERADGSLEKMIHELELTPAQVEKLKSIHEQALTQIKPKKEAMNKSYDELEALLQGKAPAGDLRTKFSELESRQDEFARARFDKLLAIREILSQEQRKKLKFGDHRLYKKNCSQDKPKNP